MKTTFATLSILALLAGPAFAGSTHGELDCVPSNGNWINDAGQSCAPYGDTTKGHPEHDQDH